MAQERFIDSLREGITEEMRADPNVIIFGEDVAVGGEFGVTTGLADEFGEKRVINTPISEDTIMGMAVFAEGNMWSWTVAIPSSPRTREPKSSDAMRGM